MGCGCTQGQTCRMMSAVRCSLALSLLGESHVPRQVVACSTKVAPAQQQRSNRAATVQQPCSQTPSLTSCTHYNDSKRAKARHCAGETASNNFLLLLLSFFLSFLVLYFYCRLLFFDCRLSIVALLHSLSLFLSLSLSLSMSSIARQAIISFLN